MEYNNIGIYLLIPLLILISIVIGLRRKTIIIDTLDIGSLKVGEYIKGILLLLGGVCIAVALLSPKRLDNEIEVEIDKLNIYILMDVSKSMLTKDIYPSRLEVGKRIVAEIIENLDGDRVGIIPFSSSAYIQMPLTDDYSISSNYIDVIDANLISGGGTSLSDAISLAGKSFDEIGANKRVVVVVSDGGDREEKALKLVKEEDIRVFGIGIGSRKGGVIPDTYNGKSRGFVKDSSGKVVTTRLNDKFLKELARGSGGSYYESKNSSNIYKDIAKIVGEDRSKEKIKEYRHYYQIPLVLGILLILMSLLIKGGIKDEE